MRKQESEDEEDKIERSIEKRLRLKSFENKEPFYHGTSMKNAEKIVKEGLKPREETKKESVWKSHHPYEDLSSKEDLVYFAECSDHLPYDSAYNSFRADEGFDKTFDDSKLGFLRLQNIDKYLTKMTDDEDYSKYEDNFISESIYIDETDKYRKKTKDTGIFCYPRMPKRIIDSLDMQWALCNNMHYNKDICNDKMRYLIKNVIPKGFKSLHGVHTFAIKGKVNPEDLELLNYDQWSKRSCSSRREGCSEEEYKVKRQYIDVMNDYNRFFHNDQCKIDYLMSGKDEKYVNNWCPKIPQDYRERNSDKIKDEWTENKVGIDIKKRLKESKSNVIDYIYENKRNKFD